MKTNHTHVLSINKVFGAALLGLGLPALLGSAAELATTTPGNSAIPFPEALQEAGVHLSRMAEGQTESLIIGNGDLYGIVWEKEGGLFLRITKNDIWDARVDTSKDGPLPKVNIRTRAVTGSKGAPPSYGHAFPQPLCAAALRIGASTVTQGTLDLQRAVATHHCGQRRQNRGSGVGR